IFLKTDGTPKSLWGAHGIFPKKYYDEQSTLEPLVRQVQTTLAETAERLKALRTAEKTCDFLRLSRALLEVYGRLKEQRALLDYDDLIRLARDLVTRREMMPWVMYKLDEGIDHILVDEAQDTSREQWRIIEALCGDFFAGESRAENERSLFVVG